MFPGSKRKFVLKFAMKSECMSLYHPYLSQLTLRNTKLRLLLSIDLHYPLRHIGWIFTFQGAN